jgi:uncharacterized protein (DUF58 family)
VTPRSVALAVGILALGAGVLTAVAPGLLGVGFGDLLVSGVGVLAVVQALRALRARLDRPDDPVETPAPERPVATRTPGASFEDVLAGFVDGLGGSFPRSRVREGLRAAAVAALARYGGHTDEEAAAAVAAGTWTDDAVAAAFLAAEETPAPPLRVRLRRRLARESSLQRGVRHTVDAVAAVAGVASADERAEAVDARAGDETTREERSGHGETAVAGDRRETGHWRGVSAVALAGVGVGVLATRPAVVLAGVVGVGYAAYARAAPLPPGPVAVERSLDADRPDPGEAVTVTVTVRNGTERVLPDLRVVDGVPPALAVVDGSPRLGTALRPGEAATFAYDVAARRGVHEFGPATLVARDLAGTTERAWTLPAPASLTCVPPLRTLSAPVSLRDRASQYVGRVETARRGEGVEFAATREYRPGDAPSRIDWNRRARTRELTTVEYREERAATVLLLVDARREAYRSPGPDAPGAVDRSVDAAGRLFATLADAGDRVGVAALSPDDCWLAPDAGADHRAAARELLATSPALSSVPTGRRSAVRRWRRRLRRRLSPGTQVVFLTPLCDEVASRLARRLDAYGHPVTVVSPDPTAGRAPGERLARVARALRRSRLRDAGVPVVDWPDDESVDAALARYAERRAR